MDIGNVYAEDYLKEIAEQGFEVMWTYDQRLQSIVCDVQFVQPDGFIYKTSRVIPFSLIHTAHSSQLTTEFVIIRSLQEMVTQLKNMMK